MQNYSYFIHVLCRLVNEWIPCSPLGMQILAVQNISANWIFSQSKNLTNKNVNLIGSHPQKLPHTNTSASTHSHTRARETKV